MRKRVASFPGSPLTPTKKKNGGGEPGNEAREQVLQSYRSKRVMRFITRFALQRRECATCGIRLKGNNHTVHAQNRMLFKNTSKRAQGLRGGIYTTCYKSHLLVLKENKPISRDSDLEELISTYTEQIPPTDEVITAHDVIKTVVRVGHILHKKQAILLPSVHNIFVSHARDML